MQEREFAREWWSGGVVEWWSGGVVEWWNRKCGRHFLQQYSISPILHLSSSQHARRFF
jgi:hypothetical protein